MGEPYHRNAFEIQNADSGDRFEEDSGVTRIGDSGSSQKANELTESEYLSSNTGGHTPTAVRSPPSAPSSQITRTLAIIKNHAVNHRFDIEARIQEAGFEIVKERQMEFDTDTDPDTLYELFGEDAASFEEGPVWVYVLERRRAIEVWNTLMGHPDPSVAKRESPNSLRALYGISHAQNGLMGSLDVTTAEIQILSLFASSPPFPTTDLPTGDDRFGSIRSISSSVLDALRRSSVSEGEYAPSTGTQPSTNGGASGSSKTGSITASSGVKKQFRARPLPATHLAPDIPPRTTRAAALRAGIPVDKTPRAPKAPPTKEQLAKTFANVPGHKRAETIQVASTAAPVIAPRMTRAASLRLGLEPAPTAASRRTSVVPASKTAKGKGAMINEQPKTDIFDGIPGHKRRETISVASAKAPTIAPRLNKSASLRAQKDNSAPPSSFTFHTGSVAKAPGLSRSNSSTSLSGSKISRPASQASVQTPASRPSIIRPASSSSFRPPSSTPKPAHTTLSRINGTTNGLSKVTGSSPDANNENPSTAPSGPVAKPKPRPSSLAAPTIAPRPNKSALLRAAKMEKQNASATAKTPRGKPAASRAVVA